MHFAAWLSVGESVKDPAGYYHNNVGGALSVLDAMVADRRAALHLLVDVRGLRQRRSRRRFTRTIRSARSTPTARRSSPSSARCRTSSAPTACAASRCATSTPPAPIPTARSARITRPRSTSSRARSTPPWGAARSTSSARTSDAGRHLPARLRPRHRPGVGARAGARIAARRRARRTHTISATAGRHRSATSWTRSSA